MLKNLEIENFRTFSHLAISRLGRVNLLVGKNGVGKTTVLEALNLYGSPWPARTAIHILFDRDEMFLARGGGAAYSLQSIFFGRSALPGTAARIGPLHHSSDSSGSDEVDDASGPIRADELRIIADIEPPGTTTADPHRGGAAEGPYLLESFLSLKFVFGESTFTLSTRGEIGYRIRTPSVRALGAGFGPPLLRGKDAVAGNRDLAHRWDQIALTESEGRVLDALQTIAPVQAVSFVEDPREGAGRIAKVRVDGMPEPIPLGALGDGVGRMFQIAVALEYSAAAVRAASDMELPANVFPMLLLDEVEVGIHHTLHADLWRFIFKAARDLGVQVFATTHSWDCVEGFQVAAAEDTLSEGVLIRLESGRGKSRAVVFGEKELSVVTREQIEVR